MAGDQPPRTIRHRYDCRRACSRAFLWASTRRCATAVAALLVVPLWLHAGQPALRAVPAGRMRRAVLRLPPQLQLSLVSAVSLPDLGRSAAGLWPADHPAGAFAAGGAA